MMFEEQLEKKIKHINELLDSRMPLGTGHDDHIVEVVRYAVSAGGKRIRPLLMQEAFDLFAKDKMNRSSLDAFSCALECIHTYSLVHDDLPCMDDAELRRGMPAVHKKFGEAFGVLSGDALLNHAYEIVALHMSETESPEELSKCARAFRVLSTKSGINGMVGGQCLDVYSEKNDVDSLSAEEVGYIYENKTAALIEAALMIGAILGGATEEEISLMEEIGSSIGMAYQIKDDLLDKYGVVDELGKDVGADEKNKKMTFIDHFGEETAEKEVERLMGAAIENINKTGRENDGFLQELFGYLVNRTK